ncbi:MAG: exoribonuclease [Verrucomicrobiaceae bacterium]|nr:exoribonuclease [Verrucomicrobiaceae bacterium]
MLNNDALAQLRSLKQQILDDKEHARGTVRGTQGRFGFAVLADGREIYLPAEQMQHVFPDDCIDIEIVTGPEGKPVALLEKLASTELRDFTGQYVVRDNAHFVEPDLPRLSRWIFIPPKQRMNAKHGDFVRASITRHPFEDGRAQARVEKVIGDAAQKGIEANYALTRFRLHDRALPIDENDLLTPDFTARRDLTALPFVTIDGAETRDMDDALFAEKNADGWKLAVAIADPSAWVKPGSKLELAIAQRGSSIYLPRLNVAMLPDVLANDRCSLQPNIERLAIVCELQIDNTGKVVHYEFSEALIRSCAKLSYDNVSEFLNTQTVTEENAWSDSVRELFAISQQLQQQRARDHIVLPERGDYRAHYDENGKIASYSRQEKNSAQQLVEECMVAVNRSAADFLKNDALANSVALFVAHRGFRPERLENVTRLLNEQLPELADRDVTTLDGYTALMQTLAELEHELPLREILFRSLERSQFSNKPTPHFGMGLPCYTTVTSPIRKFNDYLMQRAIKTKLRGETAEPIAVEQIEHIQDCGDRARQASNLAQQWLDCVYLQQQLQQSPGQIFRSEIVHVTSSGIVVRLLDNGIQGLVDTRRSGEKFSFDNVYMRLSSATQQFLLLQQVDVTITAIDMKKRAISFQLAPIAVAEVPPEVSQETMQASTQSSTTI